MNSAIIVDVEGDILQSKAKCIVITTDLHSRVKKVEPEKFESFEKSLRTATRSGHPFQTKRNKPSVDGQYFTFIVGDGFDDLTDNFTRIRHWSAQWNVTTIAISKLLQVREVIYELFDSNMTFSRYTQVSLGQTPRVGLVTISGALVEVYFEVRDGILFLPNKLDMGRFRLNNDGQVMCWRDDRTFWAEWEKESSPEYDI